MPISDRTIKIILGFFLWTLAIHLVEENLIAFYLVLGLGFNIYLAYYWTISGQPNDQNNLIEGQFLLSDRNFKFYLFHIIMAKICFFWYLYLSLEGIINTVKIWENGYFRENYQSNVNLSSTY